MINLPRGRFTPDSPASHDELTLAFAPALEACVCSVPPQTLAPDDRRARLADRRGRPQAQTKAGASRPSDQTTRTRPFEASAGRSRWSVGSSRPRRRRCSPSWRLRGHWVTCKQCAVPMSACPVHFSVPVDRPWSSWESHPRNVGSREVQSSSRRVPGGIRGWALTRRSEGAGRFKVRPASASHGTEAVLRTVPKRKGPSNTTWGDPCVYQQSSYEGAIVCAVRSRHSVSPAG
jgi:hypothetical protein